MSQNYKAGLIITGDASGGIRAIKATEDELSKLNQNFNQSSRDSRRFGNDAERAGQQVREIGHGSAEASKGLALVRQAATLAAAAFSIRQIGVYADGWSELNSRVLNTTKDINVSEQTMGRLAQTARDTYSGLNLTAEAYLNNATTLTELGYSTERQLDLSDALNNSLVISATRGQKASSVMDALSKAFADGQLRGDNFNTVIQSGGRIAEALAAGLGVTTIELRKMASEGELTTSRVFEALTSQMEVLREEAAAMPATIEDGFTLIGNSAMELVGRLDKAFGASEGIAGVMIDAADGMSAATQPLIDNMDTIQDAAFLTAAVIGGRYAAAFAIAAQSKAADVTASMAQVRAHVAATTAARAKAAETLRVALADQEAARRALANGHAIATATGNTTLRTRAITQMAAANQRAIAAEAAHTAAVNANAAAMGRSTLAAQGMSTATRVGAGALALIGGPAGAAIAAGLALYYFREELGLTDEKMKGTIDTVNSVGGALVTGFNGVRAGLLDLDACFLDMTASAVGSFSSIVESSSSVINMGLIPLQNAVNALDTTFAGLIYRVANGLESAGAMPFGMQNVFGEQISRLRGMADGLMEGLLEPIGVSTELLEDNSQALRNHANELRARADEIRGNTIPANNDLIVTYQTLDQWLDEIERGARSAGNSVSSNAPSEATLEAWSKYNDKLRENIAAQRDGGAAIGSANRALDEMGDGVTSVMRGYSIFLAVQEEAFKDNEKAQKAAASTAQQAARSQAQAAQQAARAAEQAAKKQADALKTIQQEMDPLLADYETYVDRVVVLEQALAEGAVTEEAFAKARSWAADQYTRAATGAEAYEKQTKALIDTYDSHNQNAQQLRTELEQINQLYRKGEIDGDQYARMVANVRDEMQQLALESDPAAQEMARAWEEASNRIDETFADAFAGAFDSFDSFADQLQDGFKRLLAELAYQATLRPIVVGFTKDMQGLLGGGGVSGFGNTIGAAQNLMKGTSLLGGASSAAKAGGLYAGAATQTAGTLYGSAATGAAIGPAASAGIMSSITAGVSAAMPWIAGGLAIDGLLGGNITKAIGGLFGSKKTNPHLNIDTRADAGSYGHESVRSGAFGAVGFGQGTRRSNDLFGGIPEEREFLAAIAATDDLLASLARSPEELDAMASAVQGVRLSASNVEGVMAQLSNRTVAAVSAIDGEFGAFVAGLGGDVDTIIARTQSAVGALNLLGNASENLNLQFDASAAGALRAADNIAQYAGGIDQLASLQESYYQSFFSEAERAANLQREVTQAMEDMGYAMPATRDGYRQLVEQQNRFTDAGQRNYVQLLELAGPFDQLQTMLGNAGDGVGSFADQLAALNNQISTLEDDVRAAYRAFDSQSFKQQITLMEMAGDSAGALALQRERELLSIDPLLHETQRVIWAIEDEAQAKQGAVQAAKNFASELARVRGELSNTLGGIGQWVDQQNATGGTPGMNLAEAQAQLARQLILAESGDRAALQSITQYADRVLQANDAYNASSEPGQRIKQDVLDALGELPGLLSAEEFIAQEIKEALREQTQGISSQLSDVLRGDNPSNIAGNLAGYFTTLAGGIDGVLTREQLAIVMSGKATDAELAAIMRAVDLNGDGVMSGLESVIIAGMPTDAVLGTVLRNKMNELDKNQLTHAQVRAALSPIASDKEIKALIQRVDKNGDGIISRQELTAGRIEGLASGIGSTLAPMFDSIDIDGSGWIDYGEFARAFDGMASDAELRRIFNKLDIDGLGQISRLEALKQSSDGTEGNTKTLEERARDQLSSLDGLVGEMTRTTDQFVGLNSNMVSLRDSINALGVAQAEVARIERERAEAEARERQRVDIQRSISGFESASDRHRDVAQSLANSGRIDPRNIGNINALVDKHWNDDGQFNHDEWERVLANLSKVFGHGSLEYNYGREYAAMYRNRTRANEGWAQLNGSHANGNWNIPFDGYVAELHKEEMVVPAKTANLLRELPSRGLPMPDVPLPQFPALGNNDVVQVLQDVKRELQESRKETKRLQEENNRLAAAAVAVQQAGFNGQISEQKKSNLALDDMSAAARLEGSR